MCNFLLNYLCLIEIHRNTCRIVKLNLDINASFTVDKTCETKPDITLPNQLNALGSISSTYLRAAFTPVAPQCVRTQ